MYQSIDWVIEPSLQRERPIRWAL